MMRDLFDNPLLLLALVALLLALPVVLGVTLALVLTRRGRNGRPRD